MTNAAQNQSYFTSLCIERCGGLCCDPWWGIISYRVVKQNGASNMAGFRAEVLKGIKERAKRIMSAYVTKEEPCRPLFSAPERYNVSVRDIKAQDKTLTLTILAMFAFRCNYLSTENACLIHPAVLGGPDIRPEHCGYMGSLSVKPDEKGYCRIIHSAVSPEVPNDAVDRAIEVEKGASKKFYEQGVATPEEAADAVMERLKEYCRTHLSGAEQARRAGAPGRNDPCPCGSGKKYKKCHGA